MIDACEQVQNHIYYPTQVVYNKVLDFEVTSFVMSEVRVSIGPV